MGKMVAEYGGVPAIDEGGIKYVLQDWQGSSRAIIGQFGMVQARMDYTAFGEEIQAGTGLRTTTQGFNANNNLNQKYALTERDKATGLDHTWFRKNENRAGRWTSPDPYNGSMSLGNPQSFNRYSYVENQPTNFIDPSGLNMIFTQTVCSPTVADLQWFLETGQYRASNCREVVVHVMNTGSSGSTGGTEPGGGQQDTTPDPERVRELIDSCLINISIIPRNIYDAIVNNKNDVQSRSLSLAHAATESGLLPEAIGAQGEIGLFQLKLSTASSLGMGTFTKKQLKDPATNTQLGTTHLQNLINSFGGDVRMGLGAYKQGETNVRKNGLTKKSQEYADGILGCEKKLERK